MIPTILCDFFFFTVLSKCLQFSAVQLENRCSTVAQDALYGAPVEIKKERSGESGLFFEYIEEYIDSANLLDDPVVKQ